MLILLSPAKTLDFDSIHTDQATRPRFAAEAGKIARAAAGIGVAGLGAEGSGLVIHLASNEYFAVLKGRLPKNVWVIAPDFRVRAPNGLQFQSFPAKVARGSMARWLCEERIDDPAALPSFDRDGWRFDADGSTPDKPLFVRD